MPPEEYPFDKAQEPEKIHQRVVEGLGHGAIKDVYIPPEALEPDPEPPINRNAELAMQLLSEPRRELHSLAEMYEANTDWVREVELKVDKPSAKVLHLSELLIGHKDSALDFFTKIADSIEDIKPDAIVLSGLVQGDFKILEKRRRATLVPELNSMDNQFFYAKQIVDRLAESKKPVIYNMSNDDRRISEEYTIEVFKKMLGYTKGTPNYYQIDQMQMHPRWNDHLRFQIDYVFPYCLRSGRRLKTAEELKEAMGEDAIDEYMMLYDTIKKIEKGEDPNPDFIPFIEMENLGDTNFLIADDLNLSVSTQKGHYTDEIRHNLNYSAQPMYGNHMRTAIHQIGERASAGLGTPDMLITEHNQELIGVQKDGTWVVSLGGLLRPRNFFNAKGSKSDVAGDVSRRLITTRNRIPSPSAAAYERFDDGRHVVTIFNEHLLKKAESCPRTALPLLTDWQIGSLTARPDLLIKYLDYIQSIDEEKILYLNGDFVQGRNYPNFPNENQELGLISMDSQVAFVRELLGEFLRNNGVTKAFVTPGNHEWNSGTEKWHGYSFTQYIMDALSAKGIPNQRSEGMMTAQGEKFKAWASVDYVGEYGVYVSHLPLLKGAKGAGGLPIYQAQQHTVGVGEAKKSIDFEMYGHWHHPQYGLFGDKLSVISGSLAGLSGYEWMRGYRPVISSMILHIGGGQPPQLEFLSQEFMEGWKVEGWSNTKINKFIEAARKRASRGEYTELK